MQQFLVPFSLSKKTDLAAVFINVTEIHAESVIRKFVHRALGPFYNRNAVGINIFLKSDAFKFFGVFESIKIDMVKWYPPLVLVHERECRTRNVLVLYLEPQRDAVGEIRLASSEVAVKANNVPRFKM